MDDTLVKVQRRFPDTPTRASGIARLEAFLPRAGREYAAGRNHDHGPDNRANVSGLSPWIRRRLLGEDEVIQRARAFHGGERAGKFVDEVLWRTYWKGWLEHRPGVWDAWRAGFSRLEARVGEDPGLRERLARAEGGMTGIDGFDAWAAELIETGYVHNHARMWFASIWIFTLGLPWELGAAFFYRHLLDGDPASNTLSWRWVAGLHTRGKHYLARADNVRKYTGGRHDPAGRLDERALPLPWGEPPAPTPPPPLPARPGGRGSAGLLVLGDDCALERGGLADEPFSAVAGGWPGAVMAPWRLSEKVADFSRGAVDDALDRASSAWGVPATRLEEERWTEHVRAWASGAGLERVVLCQPALGPWRDAADAAAASLATAGIAVERVRRVWDSALWPAATGGFFGFRKAAERLLPSLLPGT